MASLALSTSSVVRSRGRTPTLDRRLASCITFDPSTSLPFSPSSPSATSPEYQKIQSALYGQGNATRTLMLKALTGILEAHAQHTAYDHSIVAHLANYDPQLAHVINQVAVRRSSHAAVSVSSCRRTEPRHGYAHIDGAQHSSS